MKRFLSFLLVVLIIFSFTSCSSEKIKDFVDGSSQKVEDALDEAKDAIKNPTNEKTYDTSCEKADEIDAHKKRLTANSNFKYLPLSNYVQYSSLKGDAKKVYNLLVHAAYKLDNYVNVAYLDVKTTEIQEIYDKFIADNPQFFYLGNSFLYTYEEDTKKVKKITLTYNDGEIFDSFDSDGKLKSQANRKAIKQKIKELDNKLVSILSTIPASKDFEAIEKDIHDYIAANVKYDTITAENAINDDTGASYRFTIYSALCENIAVCEGYTKAFQYLCYLVGINSTTVSGVANGDEHIWNVVNINNTWYHTDVTWASTLYQDRISYDYYNLTKAEMTNKDHEITGKNLILPQ